MKKNSIYVKGLINKNQDNVHIKISYNNEPIKFRILSYAINEKKFITVFLY